MPGGQIEIDAPRGAGPYRITLSRNPHVIRPLCLLIHGYNTTVAHARKSYGKLLDPIARRYGFDLDRAWYVAWKGYLDPFGSGEPFKLLSGPSYPLQVSAARRAGEALAQFILNCASGNYGSPVPVIVVAHSLGCRVALEALRASSGPDGRSPVLALLLIGAAVPTHLLEGAGSLAGALTSAGRRTAMCSRSDSTLFWLFPLGEIACGEGPLPTALGWSGRPRPPLSNRVWRRCGHSDYFDDAVTGDYLSDALGCPVPRTLMETYAAEYDGLPPRRLSIRRFATRVVASRRAGSSVA